MVSAFVWFGQDQLVLALMFAFPAMLIGLVALLAITSGLERRLARSVRPAPVRIHHRHLPLPVTKQR